MTTTITLETHQHPVNVLISDIVDGKAEPIITERYISTNVKEVFHIYDKRSIAFVELPKQDVAATAEQPAEVAAE